MNLDDLALIDDIARSGSFAATARARGVDPSAVSRSISAIEAELGLRLFHRTTRRLELTEAGEIYRARITPLIEDLAQAADEARSLQTSPKGTLRLTTSVAFGQAIILPRLGAFRRAHPDVRVECVFTDDTLDLVAERIDLAIRLTDTVTGDLVVSKLMPTHYRVVAAPSYLAGASPLEEPGDLSRHRAVLFPFRDYRSRWLFRDGTGAMIEQPVDGDIVISSAGAIREAACLGLGPALLPDWLIDEDIRAGRLVVCLDGWEVTATSFDTGAWLVYPTRRYLPAKVRAMIDFLRAELG